MTIVLTPDDLIVTSPDDVDVVTPDHFVVVGPTGTIVLTPDDVGALTPDDVGILTPDGDTTNFAAGAPTDQVDTASGTAVSVMLVASASGTPTDVRDTATGSARGDINIPPAYASGSPTDVRDTARGRQSSPPVTTRAVAFEFTIRAGGLQEGPPVAVAAKQEQRDIELEDYLSDVHHANEAVIADTTQGNLPWTPTFTNLTVGAGANEAGRYAFSNGVLSCWYRVILGSSPTVGDVRVNIPSGFQLDLGSFRNPLGTAQFVDDSTGATHMGMIRFVGVTSVRVQPLTVSGSDVRIGALASTAPFTWAVGDAIGIEFHAPAHRI